MTENIIITVKCPKIVCDRGIGYCYDCDYFGGISNTMDEIICEWKDKITKQK